MIQTWYDANGNRAYPFVDGTAASLPKPTIVDAGFQTGPGSEFDRSLHRVYLESVRRGEGEVIFVFASDAPSLRGEHAVFRRPLGSTEWLLDDADTAISDSSSASLAPPDCLPPALDGFLVTGDLTELEALLPDDGSELALDTLPTIEPARVTVLWGRGLSGLTLANLDRTRSINDPDCPPNTWPFETGLVRRLADCLEGDIAIVPGFNCVVRQENDRILLSPVVGGGDGPPCEEIRLFEDEEMLPGRTTFDGAVRCGEVVRSINGVGGPIIGLSSGPGISVVSDPDNHRLIVDISLNGLNLILPDSYSAVSESLG